MWPRGINVGRNAALLLSILIAWPTATASAQSDYWSVPLAPLFQDTGSKILQEPQQEAPPLQPPAEPVTKQAPTPEPPVKKEPYNFLKQVYGDFKHLPDQDTFWWLAGGGALAYALHPYDDDVNAKLARHPGFWRPGQTLGASYFLVPASFLTWVVGRVADEPRVRHIGWDLLSTQVVTQVLTQTLKVAVGRTRPDGSDNHSFPSGHASATFAVATVLQRHLGWKAALPTYTVASYVAMSRLHENRHFLSDVIFGAAIGVVCGRTTTRHGRRNYGMMPIIGPDRVAIMIVRHSSPMSAMAWR